MNTQEIEQYLSKFGEMYDGLKGPTLIISICGGAALMVSGLVTRTTQDIDLVAPRTLPPEFFQAAKIVAAEFGLPDNWINQGPIELEEMGLPDGFEKRALVKKYGEKLSARFASRLDQIFFKTYAAVDRGGYHAEDLIKLNPTPDELLAAAKWCMTHDVSTNFKLILKDMFKKIGYDEVAEKI